MLDRPVLSSFIIALGMVAITFGFLAGKAAWYVRYTEPPADYIPYGPKGGLADAFGYAGHAADVKFHAQAMAAGANQAWKYLAGSLGTALAAIGTLWFATTLKGNTNRSSKSSRVILGSIVFFAAAAMSLCFAYSRWSLIRESPDETGHVRRKWEGAEELRMKIPKEKNGRVLEFVCKSPGKTYRTSIGAVKGGETLMLFLRRNPTDRTIKYGCYQHSYSSVYVPEYPYGPKFLESKASEFASGKFEDPFPAGSAIAEHDGGGIGDGDVVWQYRDGETGFDPTLRSAYEIRVNLRPPTAATEPEP